MRRHIQNYINELHERPAHERRRISLRMAMGVIAAVFLVWVSTLGVRLAGSDGGNVAQGDGASLVAATPYADGSLENGSLQGQNSLDTGGVSSYPAFEPDYNAASDTPLQDESPDYSDSL